MLEVGVFWCRWTEPSDELSAIHLMCNFSTSFKKCVAMEFCTIRFCQQRVCAARYRIDDEWCHSQNQSRSNQSAGTCTFFRYFMVTTRNDENDRRKRKNKQKFVFLFFFFHFGVATYWMPMNCLNEDLISFAIRSIPIIQNAMTSNFSFICN